MNITGFVQTKIAAKTLAVFTIFSIILSALPVAFFVAEAAYSYPSTNEQNKIDGHGYVELSSSTENDVTLDFVNPDNYVMCFEYRTDGDTSQILPDNGGNNYNVGVTDGLYPFYCATNETEQHTIAANEYVEVRSAFGAERDTDFNWTRFDVDTPKATETIVVSADTSAGENLPGWMFNRDLANATPIEFNEDEKVIGDGALYVLPISNSDAPRKFIGEYFWQGQIADLDGFSYDFKIGAGGAASDENEFYLNVYANFGSSALTNYYDCKYDVVPTTGSTGSFTTITFDPTATYPVTTRGSSPHTCPTSPAGMDALSNGSTIRAFSINTGDTTLTDADLDGYFDKVVLDTTTKITTFDFEPAPKDTTDPEVTIKDGAILCEGGFSEVSFKLFDEGKIDKVIINGVEKDLTDNKWSDVNFVKPGVFGAVAGDNTMVVYDVAGNTTIYEFYLCGEVQECQNLLLGGSFEEPVVTNSSLWQKFANVAGWVIEKVSDSTPTTLELHRDWSSNEAADGAQYAELDGDHSTKISQTVATLPGGQYELSWAFAARHGIAAEQNQLSVSVDGGVVAAEGPATDTADLASSDWKYSSYSFTATGAATEIEFADAGPSNSFGTFLDDAQLCLVREPEPVAVIEVTKIICEDESLLPNDGYGSINANTAADFLANLADEDKDKCRLAEPGELSFQWGEGGISTQNSPNNDGVLGSPWEAPVQVGANGIASMMIPAASIPNNKTISVREVMDTNAFIPFTGTGGSNVSAEIYCANDAANYDNLEWIKNVSVDNTYHCVAWNVEIDTTSDVTICKYDEEQNPLAGWTLMLVGSEELQTLNVPATNSTGVDSDPLVGGTSYIALAEGTWDNNRGPLNIVDAEYSTEDNWSTQMDGFTGFPTDILELFIDNIADPFSNWGTYNSAHKYAQSFIPGVDGPVNFSINDTNYADNTGSLDVSLYEGYAAITDKTGCVTFEDVPFADYTVDEIMQDDWQNVSGLNEVVVDESTEAFSVVNRDLTDIPVATVHAYKIICEDESDLPNGDIGNITANTAADWVADHASCSLVPDWEFEWAPANTANPDNDLPDNPVYGAALGNWSTSPMTDANGKTSFVLTEDQIDGDSFVWVREVLKDGYIPFTYGPGNKNNNDDVTAEMYCHTDVLNFDNYDRIDGISVDNEYHCVAWNSPVPPELTQCTIESSTNTVIVDNNDYAVLAYTHPNWIDSSVMPDAEWIWETYYSEDSGDLDNDITRTFIETFTVATPTAATLDIAADNGYMVYINNQLVLDRSLPTYSNNFQAHTYKQNVDVSSYIVNGDNELKVVATNKGVNNSNSMSNPAGVLFKLTMEIEEGQQCEVTTAPEKEVDPNEFYDVISGFKYEVSSTSEVVIPKAGWTIYAYNFETEELLTATTSESGEYTFIVGEGSWEVYEEIPEDWEQDSVYENGYEVIGEGQSELSCYFDIYQYGESEQLFSLVYLPKGNECDFYNEFIGSTEEPEEPEVVTTTSSSNSSSGTRVTNRATPTPLVAGASTSFCPFINDYMQIGIENDSWEVTKLQLFLNIFVGPTPITGVFDSTTDANVKLFQEKYRSEVLDPWVTLGIVPSSEPTGFVYKLTKWKINDLVCPGSEAYPDLDGEDLTENVDLD